jgi:curved DNA-binding protein CbpA
MTDPYEVMGISPGADEAVMRRRYLELVRQFPPEKCPEQFAEIRQAYDELRDPVARLRQQLFQLRSNDTVDDIIAELRSRVQATRIPTRTLLSLAEG